MPDTATVTAGPDQSPPGLVRLVAAVAVAALVVGILLAPVILAIRALH